MIVFRPLPALTIATSLLFAALMGLGVWQLERLQWKLALIAQVEANMKSPAVPVAEAMRRGAAAEYHHVALKGRFDNTKENFVMATGPEGAPSYHMLVPFITADGTFIVDRGRIPVELKNSKERRQGQIEGETEITGVWRTPDPPGLFTPSPDLAAHLWFSKNVRAMAAEDGYVLAAPQVIEADARPNKGGWPVGGETQVEFRNMHLQYAMTWFTLAASLLVIYFVYHASRGRLRLNGRTDVTD